jgi:hypothetical protein
MIPEGDRRIQSTLKRMSNRPQRNGSNGSGRNSASSLLERDRQPAPRPIYPRRNNNRLLLLLPAAVICLAAGLGLGMAAVNTFKLPPLPLIPEQQNAFRRAVNQAMGAAELTQTARSRKEWQTVVSWWKESIELMKAVPLGSPDHGTAQDKIKEYQRNLAYAQRRSQMAAETTSPDSVTDIKALWHIGSYRTDVIELQGDPARTVRYDSLCQEMLYYGNSTVELRNGIVTAFANGDRNLKVDETIVAKQQVIPRNIPIAVGQGNQWTMGSSKAEVFRIQGTPARITPYESTDREVLYYGNSMVELGSGHVVGYSDLSGNLKVAIAPNSSSSPPYWTIGSDRSEVLSVQGTPTQVSLEASACREVFQYGNSTVELKNGVVNGYDNGGNLKVRAN